MRDYLVILFEAVNLTTPEFGERFENLLLILVYKISIRRYVYNPRHSLSQMGNLFSEQSATAFLILPSFNKPSKVLQHSLSKASILTFSTYSGIALNSGGKGIIKL